MKFITIEEHITSKEILEECQEYLKNNSNGSSSNAEQFFGNNSFISGTLTDVEEQRIPYMDKVGVTKQVLSYINPMQELLPLDKRTEICTRGNNFLKGIIDKHPDRFSAFAYLPLWDVEASVKELERCVKELGFVGVLVSGKFDGHFLDEKKFIPIFEKAEELDVPIYFHPSMPVKEIQDYYYTSKDESWNPQVSHIFAAAGFGWHLDIGIQTVRMILSGIFDKCPNLKIITGHWGEGMIAMLDRMDYMMPAKVTGLNKNISEYYKQNIYVTPSGIISDINLKAVTDYMGADHIIWSEDYPYIRSGDITNFLMNSSLSEEQKELMAYKNAEKLFKM